MAGVWEGIKRTNPAALATLLLIFGGLALQGADAPSRAALLSFALLLLLLLAVVGVSSATLAQVASAHWISGVAAVLFVIWILATAAPITSDVLSPHLAHPVARDFGWQPPSVSIAPHATLEGLSSLLGAFAAFALGAMTSTNRVARDWTGRWLTVLTILFAVFALNAFFAAQADARGRLDAGLPSPNAAGAVFGALALCVSAMIVRAANGRLAAGIAAPLPRGMTWATGFVRAPLASAALIFALACAVLTVSRGSLFATAAGFVVLAALLALRSIGPAGAGRGFLLAPVLGVIAVGAWLFLRGSGPVAGRLTDAAAAAEGRQQLLEPHWEAFLSRPFFGNGLGAYYEINSMAATPENWSALSYAGAAHNIYVQALEEVGVVGVLLMALMMAPPMVRALRRALFGSAGVEWAAALIGASTLLLLHGAVDFELHIPAVAALFAFMLGAFSGTPD